MKNLAIVSTVIIVFSFTTFAESYYYVGKTITPANNSVSKSLPASPVRDSCTCSCGKDCAGTCTAHFSGCGLGDGFQCILDCCSGIPNDCLAN